MNSIKYKEIVINPRVIQHLGKDLITTSDVAVTELIKNSIDAKADDIRLHLFDDYRNAINENVFQFDIPEEISSFLPAEIKSCSIFVIEDNGSGMNTQQLDSGFLEIGTDIKVHEQDTVLGEKGIGRLATQRLGNYLLIETASYEEEFATLTLIDWNGLRNVAGAIRVPSIPINKVNDKYTRLWMFDINMQDYIEVPEQLQFNLGCDVEIPINRELKSAVNFLISPFDHTKKNTISMYYGKDKLDVDFRYEMLKLSESKHEFEINCTDEGKIQLYYSLNLEPWFLERVHRAMVKPEAFTRLKKPHKYYRQLLDENIDRIQNVLSKVLSEEELIVLMSGIYYELYDKIISNEDSRKKYSDDRAKYVLNKLKSILPIKGEIFSFKQNAAIGEHIIIESLNEIKSPETEYSLRALKDFLSENNGIKLYRDCYRIGYLGNKENDWIKLQQFRTKGQQWYRFDLGNTIGYVSLKDEKQTSIREISSRLDIIQNEVSDAFKMVINVVFNKLFYELNRSSNNILRVIFEEVGLLGEGIKKQVKKKVDDITRATQKSQLLSENIKRVQEMLTDKVASDISQDLSAHEIIEKVAVVLQDATEHIEEEQKIQQQAVKLLNEASEQLHAVEVEAYNNFKLMANGLITETITHELDSVCKTSRLVDVEPHFDYIKRYFVEKKDVGVLNKHVYPIYKSYNAISNKMLDVGNLYNFLEKTFIKKGTYDEFQKQNIADLIKNIECNLLELKKEDIDIECETGDLEWFVPKGVLIHVFYNLFTNAIFWIDRRRKYAQVDTAYQYDGQDKIVVEVKNEEELVIYDTGTGVISTMEDVLFQPLESGKPNHEGRGMGLYIVRQLLRSFSADIQLLEERNQYNNRYKFMLKLNTED